MTDIQIPDEQAILDRLTEINPGITYWRDDIKQAIRPAIVTLADTMTMDSLALVSDETAADAIVNRIKATSTMTGDHIPAFALLVRWLRTAAITSEPYVPAVGSLLRIDESLNELAYYQIGDIVEVISLSDEYLYTRWVEGPGVPKSQSLLLKNVTSAHRYIKPEGEVVGLAYPEFERCDMTNYHGSVLDELKVWAHDGVSDVKSGVDEQARYLCEERPVRDGAVYRAWDSCCGSQGPSKDLLGSVMRYKTALLAGAVSIDEVAVPLVSEPIVAVEEPVVAEPTEAERLQGLLDDATAALRLARRKHEQDIEIIGEVLIEESRRRSWCSEYDTIVNGLNQRLTVELPIREQDYDVTVTGYIRVPFSYNISVSAQDEESAVEIAQEMGFDESARDLLSNYTSEYDAEFENEDDFEWEASEA
jgi:hypothetical protein